MRKACFVKVTATSPAEAYGSLSELDSGYEVRIYGAGHRMIGTVLMLFFGLPSITRSLYAT